MDSRLFLLFQLGDSTKQAIKTQPGSRKHENDGKHRNSVERSIQKIPCDDPDDHREGHFYPNCPNQPQLPPQGVIFLLSHSGHWFGWVALCTFTIPGRKTLLQPPGLFGVDPFSCAPARRTRFQTVKGQGKHSALTFPRNISCTFQYVSS